VPGKWVGKSIGEIGVRTNYNVSVLAVKAKDCTTDLLPMPKADYVFNAGETIIVFGHKDDVNRLINTV